MSHTQPPAQVDTIVDPATVKSAITASEPASDPIRPTGSDTLTTESRPEVAGVASDATATDSIPTAALTTGANASDVAQNVTAEGILGYKAPGLVKSLRFSKKFFWFSDEAIKPQHLAHYLRTEKPEFAHHNAAYATQTGNGLLFYAKRVEDRAEPAGILHLGEASEITKEGITEFSLKLHGHKHTFQAATPSERDSWVATVELKASGAKHTRDDVIESHGYKSQKQKLANPATVSAGASGPSSSGTTNKSTTQITDGPLDDTLEAGADDVTNKKRSKNTSRSQSRKRASIFGGLLARKDEHEEKKELKRENDTQEKTGKRELKKDEKGLKKEEKAEEKAEQKAEDNVEEVDKHSDKEMNDAGHTAGTGETTSFDAAAVASRAVGSPLVPAEGSQLPATTAPAETVNPEHGVEDSNNRDLVSRGNKRNSLFGGFFNKKDAASPLIDRSEKTLTPEAPAKDFEPSINIRPAPPLADPVQVTSGIETDPVKQTTPATLDTNVTATSTAKQSKSSSPTSRGGIFGFMKAKEPHQEKKETKRQVKAEEKAEKVGEQPSTAHRIPSASGDTAPVSNISGGNGIAEASTTVASPVTKRSETPVEEGTSTATSAATEPLKDKRKSSFFGSIQSKKERKVDSTSDAELTDGESKKPGMLGGLFRRPSRAQPATIKSVENKTPKPATLDETKETPAAAETNAPSVEAETTDSHVNGTTTNTGVGNAETLSNENTVGHAHDAAAEAVS